MQRFDLPEEGMFLITKTSGWPHEESPCEGAFQAEIQALKWRDGQYTNSDDWTEKWFIRVTDILEVVRKVKHPCIVDFTDGIWPSIEIYDDYRE